MDTKERWLLSQNTKNSGLCHNTLLNYGYLPQDTKRIIIVHFNWKQGERTKIPLGSPQLDKHASLPSCVCEGLSGSAPTASRRSPGAAWWRVRSSTAQEEEEPRRGVVEGALRHGAAWWRARSGTALRCGG